MNVTFIHRGGEQMASYRYRAAIPARELNTRGIHAEINRGDADVIVFSKPHPMDIDLMEQCKKDGTPTVVDICDDHFAHAEYGPLYRELVGVSDCVTCPTAYMAGRIAAETGRNAQIVFDPYEVERKEPHANGNRVLWYGHQRNLKEILRWVPKLEELAVVTGPNNLLTGYIPWSEDNLKTELAYNNIVLLPGGQEYKSANRVVNAIMAGCFVVADPTDVRKEFRKYAWVGNVTTGMQWAAHHRDELNDRVAEGQDYIERNYAPQKISAMWASILEGL